MRRLKAKEMNLCRVICLDPPSLGRFAGRSDRPNSAALRHNFSIYWTTAQMGHSKNFTFKNIFTFTCSSSSYDYGLHALRYQPTVSPKWPVMAQRVR